ncbi:MAG: 2-deoxy-5-keto-D-gluconate 6-phosphate aldolase domain-containing protein [Bacteriovoracia bacterium]
MKTRDLGYSNDLFILPFDHRGSFQAKLFGIKDREPTAEETKTISFYKRIIYDGFKQALEMGVPADRAGILVDEQFGSEIVRDVRKDKQTTVCSVAMPAEKSGQDEFDFEYGHQFEDHIKEFDPTFVKVLVRLNPEGDPDLNHRQMQRLKRLSDFCHRTHHKFMFELLVPHTEEQLRNCGGSVAQYDASMRPKLMIQSMEMLQREGIEPDVWKLEGIETSEDSRAVAQQAKAGGRDYVGVIVLGRGENAEKVKTWLTVAAKTPGLIGFAVGRTVFWDALKGYKDGKHSREAAIKMVADNFAGFCDLWLKAKK